jgi:transcriptional regulator GlxA family with amidase domain
MEEELLSVDQVAQRLRLTRRTVNGYFKKYAEKLRPVKIGRLLAIRASTYPTLLECLEEEARTPHKNQKSEE